MTPRFGAKRVLMTQAIIAAVATIGFGVLSDFSAVTKSSALGGLSAFIPSAYYAWRSSRLLNPGEAAVRCLRTAKSLRALEGGGLEVIALFTPPDRDTPFVRQADRAIELIQAGKMRKVWRIIGERANFSIWEADTLEEFHADISSLPLHPWMTVDVTPMIEHPATQAYEQRVGPFPPL